jgi:hypothetical protein
VSAARVDKVVIGGVFSLDGQNFDVDNNVWLVGNDDEVLVIDAPHDAAPIVAAVAGRKVTVILTSITARLMTLPPDSVVHAGHGDDTTIATEAANIA